MAQIRIKDIYVDRVQEVELFLEMLEGKRNQHILLLKAEAGMGKSTLMKKLYQVASEYPRSVLSLKGQNEAWYVLERLASHFGRENFEGFYSQLDTISKPELQVNVSKSRFVLSDAKIDARGGKLTKEQLKMQEKVLFGKFFDDLEILHQTRNHQRIVLLLDTFEQAPDKVKEWISITLLEQIRNLPWLVTVIAGRQIPEIETILESYSIEYTLEALDRNSCWEFVERVGLTLNDEEIALIYKGTHGIPLDFASFIENYAKGAKDE